MPHPGIVQHYGLQSILRTQGRSQKFRKGGAVLNARKARAKFMTMRAPSLTRKVEVHRYKRKRSEVG